MLHRKLLNPSSSGLLVVLVMNSHSLFLVPKISDQLNHQLWERQVSTTTTECLIDKVTGSVPRSLYFFRESQGMMLNLPHAMAMPLLVDYIGIYHTCSTVPIPRVFFFFSPDGIVALLVENV